jgi:hypothetical protein
MVTEEMKVAYAELEKLGKDVEAAQANLRVLEGMGAPNTVEARTALQTAIQKRDRAMAAINAEAGTTGM